MSLGRDAEVEFGVVIDEGFFGDSTILVGLASDSTIELVIDVFGGFAPCQDMRVLAAIVTLTEGLQSD